MKIFSLKSLIRLLVLQNISFVSCIIIFSAAFFSAHVPTLLDEAKKLQFILVLLSKAGGIQLLLFMFKQRLFPLGMTTFFQSLSQVDNNIIKSQEKMTKKLVFLYSQGKTNHI